MALWSLLVEKARNKIHSLCDKSQQAKESLLKSVEEIKAQAGTTWVFIDGHRNEPPYFQDKSYSKEGVVQR